MTLKLADNFSNNFEFAYNKGDPIFGTTPLYTVLLGLLCKMLGLKAISVAFYFGLFFHFLDLVLIYKIVLDLTKKRIIANFASFMFATSLLELESVVSCMETPLFLFTLLCAYYFSLRDTNKAKTLTGLFCALSFLTRPEGVFMFIAVFFVRLRNEKKLPHRELFTFSLLVVPWVIFSTIKFGSFIPCSVMAKSLAYIRKDFEAISVIFAFSQPFIVFAKDLIPFSWKYFVFFPVLFGFYYLVIFKGYWQDFKEKKQLLIFLVFYLIFLISYFFSNPFIFLWYLVPLVVVYILGLSVGLSNSLVSITRGKRLIIRSFVLSIVIISLMQTNIIGLFSARPSHTIIEGAVSLVSSNSGSANRQIRELLYIQVANEIDNQISSQTTILAPEFGAFGYYSKAKMISSIGHVNPEVLKYLPNKEGEVEIKFINHAIPLNMVKEVLPDYIMTLEIFIRKSLVPDDWFNTHYKVVKIYPSDIFGSRGLYLYKKIS